MNRDAWYQRMPGLLLLGEEKAVLDRILASARGMTLLQIGGPFEAHLLEKARFARTCFLDVQYRGHTSSPLIQGRATELPVQSDSVDLVLLMHVLESVEDPMMVLQEAHRVLKPNGKIIVMCFNALGLWQLWHLFSSRIQFPFNGKYYSPLKIKRLLRQLDCQIDFQQTLCFRPPLHHATTAKHWLFLETLGQLCFSYCGAVFAIVATKNEPGMTPLVLKEWLVETSIPTINS